MAIDGGGSGSGVGGGIGAGGLDAVASLVGSAVTAGAGGGGLVIRKAATAPPAKIGTAIIAAMQPSAARSELVTGGG